MPSKNSFSDRVWSGDLTTMSESYRAYVHEKKRNILPFASILYSFRDRLHCARQLLGLRSELEQYADDIASSGFDTYFGSFWGDRCDMLSTYFGWMSKQPDLSGPEQERLRGRATYICEFALFGPLRLPKKGPRAHTYFLLYLTYADLLGRGLGCYAMLGQILMDKPSKIPDPRQRARVYAKLGAIMRTKITYRVVEHWLRGMGWGIRACFVPGIPLRSRLKAAASLVGYSR